MASSTRIRCSPSCSPYRPTAETSCAGGAYVRLQVHAFYCFRFFEKNNNDDNNDREVGNRRGSASRLEQRNKRERPASRGTRPERRWRGTGRSVGAGRASPIETPADRSRLEAKKRQQPGFRGRGRAPRLAAIPAPNTVGRPVGLGVRPAERAAFKLTPCLQCLL